MASSAQSSGGDFRLNPWQERHVMLILQRAEQLQSLRYALCPKRMEESFFWTIYFSDLKMADLLPPQAFGLAAAPPPDSLQVKSFVQLKVMRHHDV